MMKIFEPNTYSHMIMRHHNTTNTRKIPQNISLLLTVEDVAKYFHRLHSYISNTVLLEIKVEKLQLSPPEDQK